MAGKEANKPMDPGAREGEPGTITHNSRKCWAMQRLLNEIGDLFPEMACTMTHYNGRDVGIGVMFDLTTLDTDMRMHATDLLRLTRTDERVFEVYEDDDQVLIEFANSPRTYDNRETFNLAEVWSTLIGDDES